MFSFFTDIKNRLSKLEAEVQAIFNHIHTEVAAKFAAVEDVPAEAEKAVVADVKTDVVDAVTDVKDAS
jgi:hypothetical protein